MRTKKTQGTISTDLPVVTIDHDKEPAKSMPTFHFDAKAKINHVNIRKEGPENEKALAVDVKFQGRIDASICHFFDEKLRDFLFTDEVIARPMSMEPIAFRTQIEHCDLELLKKKFFDVTLKRFKIEPVDGGLVDLSFVATFNPSETEVAIIAEYVLDEVRVVAKPQPTLDLTIEK